MKTKKALSLLLCLVLLISAIAGTGAMSLSATTDTVKVPFRSPAILANVGDKIDLTKYGVEFAEGVNTTEGLTWWKEGVSGALVPYDNPALFANVGDTVNFADYKVELSAGNTVSAEKLTWKQELVQKIIPVNNLILQAEAGEKVDLKTFAVEGMGDSLTWNLGGKAVAEITAKAGDVLTVTDGTTTKDVIVATKDGDEYVVYENDFSSGLNGIERAPFGGSESQFAFSVTDGVFKAVRADDYVSSVENMSVVLPTYLWGLTNYSISFKSQFTDWAKKDTGASQKANGVYVGVFVHGDTTNVRPQHLVAFDPASHIYTMTRINETKYAASETLKVKHSSIIPNLSKNQWEGYKLTVEGSKVVVYTDFDNETKAPNGTFAKRLEYDFATVEGQTLYATTGAMGLAFFRSDSDVDDLKVTVPAIEYETKDATASFVGYTPAQKGITVFTVTDGTTSREVYLVTKNPEDTEYVLYENNFDVDGEFGGIERAGIGGDETKFGFSVADSVFSAVRASDYVSSVENTSLILPEYLWQFTNFSISFKAQFTDWAKKDNGTSQKATAYVGVFVHGDTTNYRPQHLVTFNPASNLQAMTRINDSKYATSETLVEKYNATIPNLSKNQWIGYKLDVEGSKVTAYTDFDAETTAPTGAYVKRVEHDFATVEGQTLHATTGAIGLAFFRSDADVDDIKVTIPATEPTVELQEITSFTPVTAGVTPITVKCGDVEKTIYVVAKNAADTEYVLYENTFDSEDDLADLTVLQGEADMSVEDGRLVLAGKTKMSANSDDGGAYIRLPEWLGAFGDYEVAAAVTRGDYDSNQEAFGFFARSANADNMDSAYLVRTRFTNTVSDCIAYAERMPDLTKPRTYTWGIRSNTSMHAENSGKSNVVKMGVAGDTVNMQIIDQDDDGTANDNYVLYATEQKNLRTGHIGLFVSKVTMYVDTVRVTVPALPKAPTAATFTPEADLAEGTIAGTLNVTLPGTGAEVSDVIYYWGNGEGKLPGYAGFSKILVVDNATSLSATIPAGTVVPAGATELRVYAMNLAGESNDCISIPLDGITAAGGEKLFSFIVSSDWHIAASMNATTGNPVFSTANNDAHFIQMIERFKAADPDATQIFFGGDLVDGIKGSDAEYARFTALWEEYADGYTFDGVIGNHEFWNSLEYADTVEAFANATGVPIAADKPYYKKTFNGYDFFFLNSSERDGTSQQSHNDSTIGEAQLGWLDAELAASAKSGKPMFIFHHQKFNQITDADALKAVLKQYPQAIFVTSHSHEDVNRKNIFSLADATMCNQFNTGAVTFIIPTHYNKDKEQARHMSQAYIAEMYEDRVVFKGMDLMTGEWLPNAQFTFAYDATPVQEPNTAVVDEETGIITVKADEGYELKAGTLLVEDAKGKWFVPTRVGWRNDGDATQYELPENAVAPYTVHAEFYQPTVDNLNMGLVGTSVNLQESGLRFVHRLNVYEKGGKLYMLAGGVDVEVEEYGLLLAAGTILKNPEDLDIETAENSMHVLQYKWPEVAKYYDKCTEHADIAVHIKNIETYNGGDIDIITRAYVKLADKTVVYGEVAVSTYNQAKG